ncbi:hypothetical protein [Crenobacter caeni]|uniref:Uncharacterized protein n=1 Tax=Crenobacter caeni TaxID=2705474 RepID=A0A6B2KUR6_9NEIS|nr:hypothetical protein [Crenobacter caeni]NDV13753.1 hypothetical protein [Crenobacter caeni]
MSARDDFDFGLRVNQDEQGRTAVVVDEEAGDALLRRTRQLRALAALLSGEHQDSGLFRMADALQADVLDLVADLAGEVHALAQATAR